MTNNSASKGVYLNIPTADWTLFSELVKKFGWQAETKEMMLDRFINGRATVPALSEEEVMDEVRAIRYAK